MAVGVLCLGVTRPALAQHTQPASATQPPPLTALITAGDSAWKAGDHPAATAAYREVVRRDPDASSRAVFRLATLRSYDNHLDEALALLRQYVRLEPRDDAGRIALARTMAWAGRYDEALAVYDSVLARDPSNTEAEKGVARVAAWRGDLAASETRWRTLATRTPIDPDAWVGLAQVLRWSGRPAESRAALRQALQLAPQHAEARTQLRWVEADLATAVQVDVIPSNDSDHNRAVWYATSLAVQPPWNGRLTFAGGARAADFQAFRGRSVGARARTWWSPGAGQWTVQGELGATHLSGDSAGVAQDIRHPTRMIVGAGVRGQLRPGLDVGLAGSRAPFDETAQLILHGITTTSGDADVSLALPAKFTASAGAGLARLTGGSTANTRHNGLASLRYAVSSRVSMAATARGFGYDTTVADGYFAPRRYLLTEGSLRGRAGGELGWGTSAEVGVGRQTVDFRGTTTSRLADRASLDVGYRFAPGYALTVSGVVANLPSTQTVAADGYRWYSIGVSGRFLVR